MVWFNVDDGFHSHPKSQQLTLGAVGLWTLAGSWCSRHLTDGDIPEHVLIRLSPCSPRQTKTHAAELVHARLWDTTCHGWHFHDWLAHQRSKEDVEADREANRVRQARLRAKRRAAKAGDEPSDSEGGEPSNVSPLRSRA